MRCPIAQRFVEPLFVVKMKVSHKMRTSLRDRRVIVKINLLVFHRTPETLDENVVVNPAPSIHADLDVMLFQKSREVGARKLRALVRVENLRLRDLKRLPNRVQTEALVQRRRELPGQNIPTVPIHDRYQVDKPLGQPNVRYIRTPGLIRGANRKSIQ